MKVNLNSVAGAQTVRYFMERGEGGVIINTASLSGLCADEEAAPTRPRNSPLWV